MKNMTYDSHSHPNSPLIVRTSIGFDSLLIDKRGGRNDRKRTPGK